MYSIKKKNNRMIQFSCNALLEYDKCFFEYDSINSQDIIRHALFCIKV